MSSETPVVSKRFMETYQHYVKATIDLTAGAAGGTACVAVGQPLDTIKVKMQTFPHLYKNSIVCFKQTIIKEKIRGLYAGTVPSLAANIAENSVLFCAYGIGQNIVKFVVRKEKITDLNPFENASSGVFAAFFSTFTLCPTELIKCKLQAMRETGLASSLKQADIGPWILTKEVFKNEGIMGFFRGFGVTLAREMPGYFFLFGGYELTRELLAPKGVVKEDVGLLRTTIAGGMGGICFWIAIFPADVVKSRLQISTTNEKTLQVIREILQKEGPIGFYKGLGPTLLRTFLASGAMFVAVEYTKRFFNYILQCPREFPSS